MNIKNSIRQFFAKGSRTEWCLFCLFASFLFLQTILFHDACFRMAYLNVLWSDPARFFAYWIPKTSVSLFLASFALVFKDRWWTVVVLTILVCWSAANLVYFRANGLFLNVEAMTMTSNMQGFWDAVRLYWTWKVSLFLLIPLIYAGLIWFLPQPKCKPWAFTCILLVATVSDMALRYAAYKRETVISGREREVLGYYMIPFSNLRFVIRDTTAWNGRGVVFVDGNYINRHSIIAALPAVFVAYHEEQKGVERIEKQREQLGGVEAISNEQIKPFLNETPSDVTLSPKCNLVVIIVESLESWVIDAKDDADNYIAPNLRRLCADDASLYCPRMKSEVRHGVSGDGLMTANTGLLPLQNGAACMLFGDNTYPNWAHLFNSSLMFVPTQGDSWNKSHTVPAYGYQGQKRTFRSCWDDMPVAQDFLTDIDSLTVEPFCRLLLTISMHAPFGGRQCPDLYFEQDMPKDLRNYLHCVHYMDSCFRPVFEAWRNGGKMHNTAMVITGDHTVFKQQLLDEFRPAAAKRGYGIQQGENYVPFIVAHKSSACRQYSNDICYQMDIFPTIMHIIGCQQYYWKGFGVNLTDASARQSRPCDEHEAYMLSDRLIRSDWFKK